MLLVHLGGRRSKGCESMTIPLELFFFLTALACHLALEVWAFFIRALISMFVDLVVIPEVCEV